MTTGKLSRKGSVEFEGWTSQVASGPGSGAIEAGGGCAASMRSLDKARNMSFLPLHSSIPTRVAEILLSDRPGVDLRRVSNGPPSTPTWISPSTVAPPMKRGADMWMARFRREWVNVGVSSRSIGITEGANVREGARRRGRTLGRRIGEVDRPRGGTAVPLLSVPCDGRGGGACKAADRPETAELPWNISCLDEALSGMLDKRLRPSPGIADEMIISVVASPWRHSEIDIHGSREDQTCPSRSLLFLRLAGIAPSSIVV